MSTKENKERKNGGRLSREILGMLAVSFIVAMAGYRLLSVLIRSVAEAIIADRGMVLTDAQLVGFDGWVYKLSLLWSVVMFVALFLFVLGKRLSYTKEILRGIEMLQTDNSGYTVPTEGDDELTDLAEAVNYLAQTQQQIRRRQRELDEEKELFIRSLSHDIRTPLTSIIAYSDYLAADGGWDGNRSREYLRLIGKKAEQIRELTDIMLDAEKRNPEKVTDAGLLMMQLAEEFEAALEGQFRICKDTSGCLSTEGVFDILELRRIFDNLISNVAKYADPSQPVELSVAVDGKCAEIRQKNAVWETKSDPEGHRIGLRSIKRIAQNYSGQVSIGEENGFFEIYVKLTDIRELPKDTCSVQK